MKIHRRRPAAKNQDFLVTVGPFDWFNARGCSSESKSLVKQNKSAASGSQACREAKSRLETPAAHPSAGLEAARPSHRFHTKESEKIRKVAYFIS
jgi:hypothetical protein